MTSRQQQNYYRRLVRRDSDNKSAPPVLVRSSTSSQQQQQNCVAAGENENDLNATTTSPLHCRYYSSGSSSIATRDEPTVEEDDDDAEAESFIVTTNSSSSCANDDGVNEGSSSPTFSDNYCAEKQHTKIKRFRSHLQQHWSAGDIVPWFTRRKPFQSADEVSLGKRRYRELKITLSPRRLIGLLLLVCCITYLFATLILPAQFHLFSSFSFFGRHDNTYFSSAPKHIEIDYYPPHSFSLGAHKIGLVNLTQIHSKLAASINDAVSANRTAAAAANYHGQQIVVVTTNQLPPANKNNNTNDARQNRNFNSSKEMSRASFTTNNTATAAAARGDISNAHTASTDDKTTTIVNNNNVTSAVNTLLPTSPTNMLNLIKINNNNTIQQQKHEDALVMLLKFAGLHEHEHLFDVLPVSDNKNNSSACRRNNDTQNNVLNLNTSHPNIVHYIRYFTTFNDAELDILQFISLVSAERFLEPDIIYLYSNIEPHGYYYALAHRFLRCLKFEHIDRMETLSGKHVEHIEHEADYNKVLHVYERGGIFLDFDAIFINATSLRTIQRHHECVISCESGCSIVNAGFISCQQHSPYMALWLEGYTKNFNPSGWVYNSGIYPTDILNDKKYNRSLVMLDERISQNPQWNEKWRWLEPNVDKVISGWQQKPATHHFLKMHELQERLVLRSDLELMLMNNGLGALVRHVFGLTTTNTTEASL